MAVDYTTTALQSNILRRMSAPSSQNLFEPEDLCQLATDELQDTIFPLIMSARAEYFVKSKYYTLSEHTATLPRLPIPPNAAGMKVREVDFGNGSTVAENDRQGWFNMPQQNREDINSGIWSQGYIGWPTGFLFENNDILLWPAAQSWSGIVRVTYFKRAPTLVPTDQAGQVVNVNSGTGEVSVSAVPTSWAVGDIFNAESQVPPFATDAEDMELTVIAGNTLTFDTVTGVEIGDWICLSGTTTVAPVPVEAHALLAQATAVKCLEAISDQRVNLAQAKYDKQANAFLKLITPRDDASVKKVTSTGRGIAAYNSGFGSFWGGW